MRGYNIVFLLVILTLSSTALIVQAGGETEKDLLAQTCGRCHPLEIGGTCVAGDCRSSLSKQTSPREWEKLLPWVRDSFDCPISLAEMKTLTYYLNKRFPPPVNKHAISWEEVQEIKSAWNIVSLSTLDGYLYAGVEGSDAGIYRTSDGVQWDQVAKTEMMAIYGISKFKGAYYAGGNEPEARILRSEDGTLWKEAATLSGQEGVISLGIFQDRLYAGTAGGLLYRSEDGTEWEKVGQFTDRGEPNWVRSLVEFKRMVYAIAEKGDILRSRDGLKWETVSWLPPDKKEMRRLRPAVVYKGELYVGTISHGEVWKTNDGSKWEMVFDVTPEEDLGYVGSLDASEDLLFAGISVGFGSGRVYRTSDGDKWDEIGLLSPHTIEALESFKGGVYAGILIPPDTKIYRARKTHE